MKKRTKWMITWFHINENGGGVPEVILNEYYMFIFVYFLYINPE